MAPTPTPPTPTIPPFADWWAPYKSAYESYLGSQRYPRFESNVSNRYNWLTSRLGGALGTPPAAPGGFPTPPAFESWISPFRSQLQNRYGTSAYPGIEGTLQSIFGRLTSPLSLPGLPTSSPYFPDLLMQLSGGYGFPDWGYRGGGMGGFPGMGYGGMPVPPGMWGGGWGGGGGRFGIPGFGQQKKQMRWLQKRQGKAFRRDWRQFLKGKPSGPRTP